MAGCDARMDRRDPVEIDAIGCDAVHDVMQM
ncbi:MAG: hypothetical protein GAK33_04158 [Burkholderia lata]|uniref:Uncharacterized protein n=1 Tax=Burkholderia lata (strain ATCC 17760 / DSM 23089 / LMG 22485 / NCIMB 9086 / R18194 / 383) TaxID=482957 RepID=A0A833PSF6_BURL3|nr:MAG: hypothetical protein GAK33_04158 [Burkholderia lata]